MSRRSDSLDDDLARALAGSSDCPPPETFERGRWDSLTFAERGRIGRHADRCAACSAERELARAFDHPKATGLDADEAFVAERLDRLRPSSTLARAGGRSRFPADWRWVSAAALVGVALVAGLVWRGTPSPAPLLPDPPPPSTERGIHLRFDAPRGDLARAPGEARWEAHPGAESYLLRLVAIDGKVIWSTTAPASSVELPAVLVDRLAAHVTYRFEVDALDAQGRVVAASAAVGFRIRPETGGGGS
ncbi:MAG TPA: hypothetical protein VD788_06145 [Candidatus Polarisedimenticolaceae bacterium]|nr:hypothetical protein [Candidatus Polarisedimenticolaceae bacterium]